MKLFGGSVGCVIGSVWGMAPWPPMWLPMKVFNHCQQKGHDMPERPIMMIIHNPCTSVDREIIMAYGFELQSKLERKRMGVKGIHVLIAEKSSKTYSEAVGSICCSHGNGPVKRKEAQVKSNVKLFTCTFISVNSRRNTCCK